MNFQYFPQPTGIFKQCCLQDIPGTNLIENIGIKFHHREFMKFVQVFQMQNFTLKTAHGTNLVKPGNFFDVFGFPN